MQSNMPPLPFNRVAAVVADALGVEPSRVTPCASLCTDLSCDSLDFQAIACELDIAFHIEIPDEDVASWRTGMDIASTVARLAAAEVA